MANIVGDYKLIININGKNHILKDKIRLEKSWGDKYKICFSIKGNPELSHFVKNYKGNAWYYSNDYWINYKITYKNLGTSSYGSGNNDIFHIINSIINSQIKIIKKKHNDYRGIGFNFLYNLYRNLKSFESNINEITEWINYNKNLKVSILKFNERTHECIKNGYMKLEINIDKQRIFACII